MRFRVGVLGGRVVLALDEVVGRWGETGRRGEGGVTSVWRIEVNIAFACSVGEILGSTHVGRKMDGSKRFRRAHWHPGETLRTRMG
jgi:hypothetical protein